MFRSRRTRRYRWKMEAGDHLVPHGGHEAIWRTAQMHARRHTKNADPTIARIGAGQVEYSLTPQGRSLRPVLAALCKWGTKHREEISDRAGDDSRRQVKGSTRVLVAGGGTRATL